MKPKHTFLEAEGSKPSHESHQVEKEKAAASVEHEIRPKCPGSLLYPAPTITSDNRFLRATSTPVWNIGNSYIAKS